MSLFETFGLVAGYLLAATKLFNTAKPYWGKLPAVVGTALPTVVVLLPAIADRLAGLQSPADLKALGLAALALLLPGAVNKAASK